MSRAPLPHYACPEDVAQRIRRLFSDITFDPDTEATCLATIRDLVAAEVNAERERLRPAAARLYRRGEDNGGNTLNALRAASETGDTAAYYAAQERGLQRQQDAWEEFIAAATGVCVCGRPVATQTEAERNDGSGKAASRTCACGRSYVVGE